RAYQARAEVALVCFAGGRAEVRLQPARARPWSEAWIHPIAGGGVRRWRLAWRVPASCWRRLRTLSGAAALVVAAKRWRSMEQPPRPHGADAVMVVDFERQAVALGRCRQLAAGWEGEYLVADALIG
ncbi:Mg-chelatase subunit ChlD-like protein, partial [Cupriavidus basilensis OR16]